MRGWRKEVAVDIESHSNDDDDESRTHLGYNHHHRDINYHPDHPNHHNHDVTNLLHHNYGSLQRTRRPTRMPHVLRRQVQRCHCREFGAT